MIDGLKLNQLLAGFRGTPAGRPQGARSDRRWRSAQFYLDHRARIREIEINPLMVRAPARSPSTCACCGTTTRRRR